MMLLSGLRHSAHRAMPSLALGSSFVPDMLLYGGTELATFRRAKSKVFFVYKMIL